MTNEERVQKLQEKVAAFQTSPEGVAAREAVLRAGLEAMRMDAQRYRFLRMWCPNSIMVHGLGFEPEEIVDWTKDEIDAAIDAAAINAAPIK